MPAYIVMDTQMPERLVDFYTELQGVEVIAEYGEGGQYVALGPNNEGLMLVFQKVPEPKVGKNRAHFDLVVPELDGPTERVRALGGRWLEEGRTHELAGFSWRVMADPEGNEFCLYLMAPGVGDQPLPPH